MSAMEGKENIISGWEKSGILYCIKNGSKNLPPSGPFIDLGPHENVIITESLSLSSLHSAELESRRQKAIINCVAEDEEVEADWEGQIE